MNVFNIIDTKEYYNDIENNDKSSQYVSRMATNGATIIALFAFIVLSFVVPFSMINILSGICLINVVINNYLAERVFGPKIKPIMDIYCVSFLMLSMPIQWFGLGGFHGPGALWMIFATVYCIFTIYTKVQRILLRAFGIEVFLILVANLVHPEFEVHNDNFNMHVIGAASVIGIGIYVQSIIVLQNFEFYKERKRIQKVQEELTDRFEESIAANDELHELTESLELANKTQKSFTASMNHELRAPLNGIEGCLQILLLDDTLSEEGKETVRNAITASKTINQTVNDLLDFSKLEEGKFEIVNKSFDLRDVLDNIQTIFRPLANAKNLKFTIQIPKDARVSIYGDGIRIQQVMTNLVSNGIKYTRKGSVNMTVRTERGHLIFDVKDSGQGMDEECIKTLFDPFTRFNINENVNIQGTGLGMNIVANLIKAMDGSIEVESTVDVGSNFHVDIPIMFYDSDILYSTPRKNDNDQAATIDLSNVKALCVDDTEINRAVFKGMLKNTGIQLTLADHGSQAINLCENNDFDIIFMDHMMPEMDGIETIDRIRELPGGRYSKVPVIMFTGNASEEYEKLYKEHGACGMLIKPIMYDELIDCFRKNLSNK